jgi:hypothetical protein
MTRWRCIASQLPCKVELVRTMVIITMNAALSMLQGACKALAVLLADSGAAKQECLRNSETGGPAWPEVAESVRQVN